MEYVKHVLGYDSHNLNQQLKNMMKINDKLFK